MNILGVSLSSTAIAAITGGTIVLVTMVVILVEAYVRAKKRYGGAIDSDGDEVSGWELLMIGTRILSAEDVGVAGQERDGTASDQQDASSGSNPGATWAIALILVLLVIAGVGFWLYKRRKGEEVEEVVSRVNRTTRNVVDNMKKLEPDAKTGLRTLENFPKGGAITSWFKSSGRDFAAEKNRIAVEAEAERRRIEEVANQKAREFSDRAKALESKKGQLGSELAELRKKEQELAGQGKAAAAALAEIEQLIKEKKKEIAEQTKAWEKYDKELAKFNEKQASYKQDKEVHDRKEDERIAGIEAENLKRIENNKVIDDLDEKIREKTRELSELDEQRKKEKENVKLDIKTPDLKALKNLMDDLINKKLPDDIAQSDKNRLKKVIKGKLMELVNVELEKKGMKASGKNGKATLEDLVNLVASFGEDINTLRGMWSILVEAERVLPEYEYKPRRKEPYFSGTQKKHIQVGLFGNGDFRSTITELASDTSELDAKIRKLAQELENLNKKRSQMKRKKPIKAERKEFVGDAGKPPKEPKLPRPDKGALNDLDRQKKDAEQKRDAIAARSGALQNDLEKNRKEQEQLEKEQKEIEKEREREEKLRVEKLRETEAREKEAQENLKKEQNELEANITNEKEQETGRQEEEVEVQDKLQEAPEPKENEPGLREGRD